MDIKPNFKSLIMDFIFIFPVHNGIRRCTSWGEHHCSPGCVQRWFPHLRSQLTFFFVQLRLLCANFSNNLRYFQTAAHSTTRSSSSPAAFMTSPQMTSRRPSPSLTRTRAVSLRRTSLSKKVHTKGVVRVLLLLLIWPWMHHNEWQEAVSTKPFSH